MDKPLPLILASQSPRRRQLLALGGYLFTPLTVDADEDVRNGELPDVYTQRVSRLKAHLAATKIDYPAVIIAADTTVADGDSILGKPATAGEARAILHHLRGRVHRVYTAVHLFDTATRREQSELAITEVKMRTYNDAEVDAYIDSGDPFDKAGSYAIQNATFSPVENISGCYSNVVGLPLCHLLRSLRRWNILPAEDTPAACQKHHQITCPVFNDILGTATD